MRDNKALKTQLVSFRWGLWRIKLKGFSSACNAEKSIYSMSQYKFSLTNYHLKIPNFRTEWILILFYIRDVTVQIYRIPSILAEVFLVHKTVHKPVWHVPLLSVQWINSWWWTDELSETCRVSCQNKFVKLVHLVGFIIRKCAFVC
jgi:hypothetical protein